MFSEITVSPKESVSAVNRPEPSVRKGGAIYGADVLEPPSVKFHGGNAYSASSKAIAA